MTFLIQTLHPRTLRNRKPQYRGASVLRLVVWSMIAAGCVLLHFVSAAEAQTRKPSILWITCEDISPHLGCYGDEYATTPHLDQLATQSVRYTHAFATSGVCAPARSCLITGVYPSSMGTQYMRCSGTLPPFIKCFPEYLREAGYYCTNNSKEDYNFATPPNAWDESGKRAHWRERTDPEKPFFSVFNFTVTHESKTRARGAELEKLVRSLKPEERHDPAKAVLPPYYPDTTETRRDWANNADLITVMDRQVGNVLKQLEEDGLAESTIVFFFSDHGVGLPRAKRWLYDSGMHVPLMIRFPQEFESLAVQQPGSVTDRLVSFVDFAPTVLSLAGVPIPEHIQGEAFLGEQASRPREYVFGIRDRMDERYDMIRAVRDHRFKYIRNYMPHLPYAQYLDYCERGPTMQAIRSLHEAGKLSGPTRLFLRATKPVEELYDTQEDPHEIYNLVRLPHFRKDLERLRRIHQEWVDDTRDLGLLPESILRTREQGTTAYELARQSPAAFPRERILATAELVQRGRAALPQLQQALSDDDDAAVRYWAAVGLIHIGPHAGDARKDLNSALSDESPVVRVAVAHALCNIDQQERGVPELIARLQDSDEWVRLSAAIALDSIGDKAKPAIPAMEHARDTDANKYVARVTNHALNTLQGTEHKVR